MTQALQFIHSKLTSLYEGFINDLHNWIAGLALDQTTHQMVGGRHIGILVLPLLDRWMCDPSANLKLGRLDIIKEFASEAFWVQSGGLESLLEWRWKELLVGW